MLYRLVVASALLLWTFGSAYAADPAAEPPVRLRFVLKDADLYSLRFR